MTAIHDDSHAVPGSGIFVFNACQALESTGRVKIHVVQIGQIHKFGYVGEVDAAHCLKHFQLLIQLCVTRGHTVRIGEHHANEQAYYALTAYYRFLTGKTNLYDMTDTINKGGDPVEAEPTVPAVTEPAEVEPAKTSFPWWIIAVCIFGGVGWGIVIGVVLVPKLKKKD